ncbi:MAG: biopolymer transporter ExbD [Gammaproteobacteria bacterium]|nr:MAG: biopolymer transporter ExbD [Gammaproteobacteria bacterium]
MNFTRAEEDRLDVNITPLIDVVFLLLIFFMVTTTFNQQAELRVDLPEASSEEQALEVIPIEITIDPAGAYYVNGQSLANNNAVTLLQSLQKIIADDKDKNVIIRADATTPHQAVVTAMDAVAKAGVSKLSIATSKPK